MKVLITGGSGSYGNALVRKILNDDEFDRIVIYSRGEHKQEEMARLLGVWGKDHPKLRFFIGDVRDERRLELAMHDIDTVIHAAAMKIVPTAEYNPTECVATNVHGAENVVQAALRCGVKKVLALSTDKAVNPTNLYGATKLTAEKIFVAANNIGAGQCAFSVMRYGNVAGSAGSVLPLFKVLAARHAPITITDKRMTRFWITMEQAVQFSLRCLYMMHGREIYVPKIPSIRIVDLAEAVAPGLPVTVTGIRPGEKLHEVLLSEDEARHATEHLDYFRIHPGYDARHEGRPYRSDNNIDWLRLVQLQEMYGERSAA